MTHSRSPLPLFKSIATSGAQLRLNDGMVTVEGALPGLAAAVAEQQHAILEIVTPKVTPADARRVRDYLADSGVLYVTDPAQADRAVETLLATAAESGILALDTETAVLPAYRIPVPIRLTKAGTLAARQAVGDGALALDPHRAHIRLVQCYAGDGPVYVFDLDHLPVEIIRRLIAGAPALALFNAVFDIKFLISIGAEPTCRIFDVMTACWQTIGARVSLEEASAAVLGFRPPKTLGASDWSAPALTREQLDYAALDALLSYDLWAAQRQDLDEAGENAQELADGCIVPIARMELAGAGFDAEQHDQMMTAWRAELADAEAALRRVTQGRPLDKPAHLAAWIEDVTPDAILDEWPLTKTGALTTAAPVLKLHRDLPGILEVLEVRRLRKLLEAFGDGLAGQVNPVTGRLHPSFRIAGARTGRFSSIRPNFQQMPKRGNAGFRRIFVAAPGHVLIILDYSQIELRVIAELVSEHVGEDSLMREAFAAGVDLHTRTALGVTGKTDPAEVTKAERTLAKALNFGLIYGASARTFMNYANANYGTALTLEDAEDARAAFFETYPDLRQWQIDHAQRSRESGGVSTVGGRHWRWDWNIRAGDADDSWFDYDDDAHTDDGFRYTYALNHPVQGSAAEVMMLALSYLDPVLRRYDARLIATVHDEVIIECREDPETLRAVARLAKVKMTRAWLDLFPQAPWCGLVEPVVGRNWADTSPVEEWLRGECTDARSAACSAPEAPILA